jgi:hypothetical protein
LTNKTAHPLAQTRRIKRPSGQTVVDVLADIGRRAFRQLQGLTASVRQPNRNRLRVPIDLRDHALDGFQSVLGDAIQRMESHRHVLL